MSGDGTDLNDGWFDVAGDIGRWTNTGLSIVLLILVVKVAGENWRVRSAGNRFLWMCLGLFCIQGIAGSVEGLIQDLPVGSRIALLTVALVYGIVSLWTKSRGDWWEDLKERRDE